MFDLAFFLTSIGLGFGLAMDAFSVSLANGLNESKMKIGKMSFIAGVFAFFQFAMPMIGWICVKTVAERFTAFSKCIPWIALILLGYIGGKMLIEGLKCTECECCEKCVLGFWALIVQGIGTSIDALSTGFAIDEYSFIKALVACLVIGILTFVLCFAGLEIGKRFGTKLAGKASVLGGSILVLIGIFIFIKGVFF